MGSCAANAERPGCTYVVGADGVDLLDLVAEGHGLVREQLNELVWCRFAREELKLLVYRATPRDDHTRRDLWYVSSIMRVLGTGTLTMIAPTGSRST